MKIIWTALSALLIVGISYQAKKTYEHHQASINHGEASGTTASGTSTAGNQNLVNGVNGSDAVNPANGGAAETTIGANGNGATSTETKNGVSVGANVGTNSGSVIGGGVNAQHAGTSGVNGVNGQAAQPVVKVEPQKPKDNCFTYEYRHKKEAKDQDIENFLDYTNAFPIARADYNPNSVCVKVNQKAVNYTVAKAKSGTPEVRVGSMVGPESVIRVSYCVGKVSHCHETCVQPKKRFMDDLMNDAGDEDSFSDSWGKDGDDKNKKDLKEKSKELRAVASENDHLNESSIQRDWDELQKQEFVCK
jgi:hypothetical protein